MPPFVSGRDWSDGSIPSLRSGSCAPVVGLDDRGLSVFQFKCRHCRERGVDESSHLEEPFFDADRAYSNRAIQKGYKVATTVSTSKSQLVSVNPADGSVAGTVGAAAVGDVDSVVDRARHAYRTSGWRNLRPSKRATTLHAVAGRLLHEKEQLAKLQMQDNGKPLSDCRRMVDSAAGIFRYFASVCETLETEVTPQRGDYLAITVLEPFGVVAAITPWNSPLIAEAQKVAPALAVGNAVILKPSEDSPLLAPELARICAAVGLPDDQFQVLQGPGETVGTALVTNPGVRMISFTGGTETGRIIGRLAGERLVPVALELGGKSPHIVFSDANLDEAVAGVVSGIFSAAGQSCVAGSRLFIQRDIYQPFLDRIVERAKRIRTAAPWESGVEMGPLASFHQRDRVAEYVEIARADGGRVLCGGRSPSDPEFADGAYYLPTVIDQLSNASRACREEIFGPVLLALPFEDEDDLVSQANDTDYGLACGIWTENFKKAWRVARQIEAGSVWINTYKQFSIAAPFGGFKDSGIGREKGITGLRAYGEMKSVFFGLHEGPLSLAHD